MSNWKNERSAPKSAFSGGWGDYRPLDEQALIKSELRMMRWLIPLAFVLFMGYNVIL